MMLYHLNWITVVSLQVYCAVVQEQNRSAVHAFANLFAQIHTETPMLLCYLCSLLLGCCNCTLCLMMLIFCIWHKKTFRKTLFITRELKLQIFLRKYWSPLSFTEGTSSQRWTTPTWGTATEETTPCAPSSDWETSSERPGKGSLRCQWRWVNVFTGLSGESRIHPQVVWYHNISPPWDFNFKVSKMDINTPSSLWAISVIK